jgi:MFS family permease
MNPISKLNSLVARLYGGFRPEIWAATFVFLLNVVCLSISMPFLALYFNEQRGVSVSLIGVLFLVGGLCSSVTEMAGGTLSDRFGRRSLLLGAMMINAVLFLGLAAMIWFSAPVWAIAIIYVASRSVLTTIWPVLSAMITDLAPREKLTQAYGLLRVGSNIGWAIGPALGGFLATFLSFAYLWVVAALANFITIGISLRFLKESFQGRVEKINFRSIISLARNRKLVIFSALSLLIFIVMGQLASTVSVYTVNDLGFSTAQYGLLLTLNGLLVVVFQYPLTLGIERTGQWFSLILGSILYGIGYLSFGLISSFELALVAMVVITFGEMLFSPTSLSFIGGISPVQQRGRYMGFFWLSQSLGISIGPLIGGVLLDQFSNQHLFIWAPIGTMAFASAIGFLVWSRSSKQKDQNIK